MALRDGEVLIDRFFFDVRRGALLEGGYAGEPWDKVRQALAELTPRAGRLRSSLLVR